jgi:flavin-dependent dehydrogenase
MVYMLVTVQIQRGKLKEWAELYEKHFLPATKRQGQKLVAAWKTTVGTYDEVTDLYAFENLAEFEKIRKNLFQDPEVQKYLPFLNSLSGFEISKIMEPLPYSEMK